MRMILLLLAIAACTKDHTDMGDVTVGQFTFDVFREGPACAAGVSTDIVVKPVSGGMPDTIVGWVGLASGEGSPMVQSVFDPGDGDFDTDLTCPNPMPAGAEFFFTVDGNETGSIDLR